MSLKEKNYKELEHELQKVMSRVESASYEDIDQLIKDYDEGKSLLDELELRLKQAKNKIVKAL